MKYWWWKILSLVLFTYVLLAGMLTPLKPGIVNVDTSVLQLGTEATIKVKTYNTQLNSALQNLAYLKISDDKVIRARTIQELNPYEAKLSFNLPASLTTGKEAERATLIINNEIDGSMILPNAVLLKKGTEGNIDSEAAWIDLDLASLFPSQGYKFPYRNILNETIRNTFFHVAIWFAMFILLFLAIIYSFLYLKDRNLDHDARAASYTIVAIHFGIIGLITGAIWAKFTWGAFWTADVKLNMAAISMAIYLAYWLLRSSIKDIDSKARISASYNIFAFLVMIPLIFIIPRLTDSLHPGNGGNPALGGEDLDNTLRMVFYPSIIALTLIGLWMSNLSFRYQKLLDNSFED